jgi:hypothetical protein
MQITGVVSAVGRVPLSGSAANPSTQSGGPTTILPVGSVGLRDSV